VVVEIVVSNATLTTAPKLHDDLHNCQRQGS
jgi:hypothetical protein